MSLSRIRLASLHDKVISAEQAAQFIENGMTVGMSGFTVPVKLKLFHKHL